MRKLLDIFLAFVHTFYRIGSNKEEVWTKERAISKLFIHQIITMKKSLVTKATFQFLATSRDCRKTPLPIES